MIKEITLTEVACYKSPVRIQLAKDVCLFYGLNGSGKSTLSNYLYDPKNKEFSLCSHQVTGDLDILVYNHQFIEDYFYEDGSLKGVFTLSKENKDIKGKIKIKEGEEKEALDRLTQRTQASTSCDSNYEKVRSGSIEKVWEIKTTYAGGDRILEYCITGLMRKERLYDYLKQIPLPKATPPYSIDTLKERATALSDENTKPLPEFDEIVLGIEFDNNPLLERPIQGSKDGPVAEFIETLNNSDWVSRGLSFVRDVEDGSSECPFCQQNTITKELLTSIRSVFDGKYNKELGLLSTYLENYKEAVELLNLPSIEDSQFISDEDGEIWKANSEKLLSLLDANIQKISNKRDNPQICISLSPVSDAVATLNNIIKKINKKIIIFNLAIANREKSLNEVKNEFWQHMRRQYDQTVQSEERARKEYQSEKNQIDKEMRDINSRVSQIREDLRDLRKKTVNVDSCVDAINSRLADLGVQGFRIEKFCETTYRLARDGQDEGVFRSLSEGEKTLISFLYFIERCHGTLDPNLPQKNKVVVIDDPISNLSHIYVFNIGQYIKREFVNSATYSQVVVLTHSLYFFYELTFTKKEDRDARQSLHRLIKTANGTEIKDMRYEEIQNDYQTYWSIVKDSTQQPALIANCMRNIIEHFFAFVRKRDFNNVFQLPELSEDKFKCFNRYMNRESHSLGQNIFDIKEFDYAHFMGGLKLVFEKCGYGEHYKAMMK